MVTATHTGISSSASDSYSTQVDDPSSNPTVDGSIEEAKRRAQAINDLATEFNVPAAPIAQGISKLRAAITPPDGPGGCRFCDANAVNSAIDDIVMALVSGGGAGTPGAAAQVTPTGGAQDSGNGTSGDGSGAPSSDTSSSGGTDANGRYADANGKFPDANGRYADANGRYPDANGRYPDASGNYPDAAGNYGASGSGAADPSAGADGQYTLDDMAALREKLMAMGIPPAEIDRIIARLEEKFGITDPAQTGIEPTATPTIGPIANTPDALMTPNSPVGGSPSAAGTPITGGASLSAAAIASNPAIGKYSKEISTASAITGMSPELLGAQMWAESRGNASTATTNGDGTTDWGLMQVGNERWKRDIVPGLSSTQRAAIEKATGKPAEQLDMRNPLDNIIGGAVHIQQYIDQNGGNLNAGLAAYVGRDSKYVGNVTTFMQELKDGKQLSNLAGA